MAIYAARFIKKDTGRLYGVEERRVVLVLVSSIPRVEEEEVDVRGYLRHTTVARETESRWIKSLEYTSDSVLRVGFFNKQPRNRHHSGNG